jgi:uncharacterized small protein (DUF1192 family)
MHGPQAGEMGKGNAMAEDDDLPVRKPRRLEPLRLDSLSVDELHDYVGELRAEIARVEADVVRKQSHRSAADAFFKPR